MGLDIMAYGGLELLEVLSPAERDKKYHWSDDSVAYAYPETVTMTEKHWPGRSKNIVPGGVYKVNGAHISFRAGSYGGYNQWREWLCWLSLGCEPRVVWNNPDRYEGKPFYELINFSDCEGIIGPDVSRKLAQDFAEHQDHAVHDTQQWFVDKYADWRKAFEIAASGGFVDFC